MTLRPFSRSLPMALMRTRESVMRHFRPSLHAAGLTEQQWRVLRALKAHETMEAKRLAEATFLLAPSLTRILRDLESRNLIRRRANPDDGRVSLIGLSAQGLALIAEMGSHSERIYRAIEIRIGRERLERLMRELGEIEAELQAPLKL